jgi:hypothetical protein
MRINNEGKRKAANEVGRGRSHGGVEGRGENKESLMVGTVVTKIESRTCREVAEAGGVE